MNTKVILATTVLLALFAGNSAHAEGRAGGLTDYVDNSTTSVEIKKVSVQTPASVYTGVNR